MTKPGYLYVLIHPSDPGLYKVGITILTPEKRLAQHNCQYEEYAGRIVKETGQKWELKTFIAVPDTVAAESAFWAATEWADIPYRRGIEIAQMDWATVQAGLDAARNARPRPMPPTPAWVPALNAWMVKRLKGRGIALIGDVRSKFGKSDFQCRNGHQWRTRPNDVAEGRGCPECGMGTRSPEEVRQAVGATRLLLFVHPDKPGLIRVGLENDARQRWDEAISSGGWEQHRYRNVEEPALAETLIWQLLGCPMPEEPGPVALDLPRAEEAFRGLVSRMQQELAVAATEAKGLHPA